MNEKPINEPAKGTIFCSKIFKSQTTININPEDIVTIRWCTCGHSELIINNIKRYKPNECNECFLM